MDTWDGVAVVGAGIAGLATANALQRAGVPARVYEQAGALGEVGAGVALTANALRILDRLGLGAAIDEIASPTDGGMVVYTHHGVRLGGPMAGRRDGQSKPVHRADLVDVLSAPLDRSAIRLGARLAGVEPDADGVSLRFADGSVERVAAVVGADGIHSVVRGAVADAPAPTFSGMIAYRGLVPATALPDWPLDEAKLFAGPGKHFLVFPVRRYSLLNFVAFVVADEEMRESWSAPGDPAALVAEFEGWADEVQLFTRTVERTFRWGLYDREPLPAWANGRIALAGDAAHAMLPHAGQGANQSVEDAAALAVMLRDRPLDEASEAFAAYDRARRERGSFVQQYARRLGLEYDGHGAALAARTDLADKEAVTAWLVRHDAIADAARVRAGELPEPLPLGAPV